MESSELGIGENAGSPVRPKLSQVQVIEQGASFPWHSAPRGHISKEIKQVMFLIAHCLASLVFFASGVLNLLSRPTVADIHFKKGRGVMTDELDVSLKLLGLVCLLVSGTFCTLPANRMTYYSTAAVFALASFALIWSGFTGTEETFPLLKGALTGLLSLYLFMNAKTAPDLTPVERRD